MRPTYLIPLILSISSAPLTVTAEETAADKKMTHKHTNRLVNEKSPYLLQHAHNPVDWYPWGDEAFAAAKEQNKPILLSIGYSTCHWCHVMERESFENEEIAKQMNESFICVKLDREERPDVDKIYMTFVQALSGSGGWPLNVFLTPDLQPVFGGTYFPPKSAQGQPSWPDVMNHITKLWTERREDLIKNAAEITGKLKAMSEITAADGPAPTYTPENVTHALAKFKDGFDQVNGGWGGAPKFPSPSRPRFMLWAGVEAGDNEAIQQVLHTCKKMAAGGMYDQIGGGFARYSVDSKWLVPHFEKMLYDNAQLAQLYTDAYLVSGKDETYAAVVRDILRYVLRDMTHPEGGFFSAEDADSEGKEGKFYTWTKAELKGLLTEEEFQLALRRWGMTDTGNFEDHSDPEPLKNQNVLSVVDPALTDVEKATLASAVDKLFKVREKRVHPGLDDKILTSWNGLMLGAVARAYAVLGDEAYLAAAEKNLAFLQSKMWDGGKLYHRWRDGHHDNAQLLDDHAFLLDGTLELYQATLKPAHLEFAIKIADHMIAEFYDEKNGGFFQSAATADLLMRVKEDYDGAEPSGNSVAALALLKLAAITEKKSYREAAEKTLALFHERIIELPEATAYFMMGVDFAMSEPRRAVIAGDDSAALLKAVNGVYQPHKVVLGTSGPVEEFATTLPAKDSALVYICKGTHCELPTNDVKKVAELMTK